MKSGTRCLLLRIINLKLLIENDLWRIHQNLLQQICDVHRPGDSLRNWWFYLLCALVSLALNVVALNAGTQMLSGLWSLAILLPIIAAGVRRMHDHGKSGWFLLIPFYNLYLLIIEGQRGITNEYGPDPLNPAQDFDFENRQLNP